MRTWERDDPYRTRPIAAPLEQCAELLGIDLAVIRAAAATVEPYLRADGAKVWSLMQLERQLRPKAYGRRRGGYIDAAVSLPPTLTPTPTPDPCSTAARTSSAAIARVNATISSCTIRGGTCPIAPC